MDPPGLPNIHVAVISSDMGAGDGSVAGCDSTGGKKAIFQYTARGPARRAACRPTRPSSRTSAASRTTPALPDVFTCIAALGEGGCGFEHQFAAIRARSASTASGDRPPRTQVPALRRLPGHRPDHQRGRLLRVARHSAVRHAARTPTSRRSWARPRTSAATSSATCAMTAGNAATRTATRPATTSPRRSCTTACRSNDTEGYLLGVDGHRETDQGLKADPGQVLVAAITVPRCRTRSAGRRPARPTPRAARPPALAARFSTPARPAMAASPIRRSASSSSSNQFGANGLVLPICATTSARRWTASRR